VGAPWSIGFFGKLPCNGDFIQRRMPEGFVDGWDPWLQACIHASRQALGEEWLDVYLSSPIWRFVLTESVCGSGAYAGVLAPSVDRVGRYFPLTVVTQIDVEDSPLDFAIQNNVWFSAVESLFLHSMEEPQLDIERFDAELEASAVHLGGASGEDTRALKALFVAGAATALGGLRAPIYSAAELQLSITAFAYRELHARFRPVTLWWSEGSQASAPSWLTMRGLPLAEQFAALLNGRWAQYGWQDLGSVAMAPSALAPVRPSGGQPTAPADAPAATPRRATFPQGQLTAIESNHAAFIDRADIGVWGVAAAGTADHDPTAVRLVADVLQRLSPEGSLTALVEAVRRALSEVHAELRRLARRDVQRIESLAHAIILVVAESESAVVIAGETQRIRVRERQLEWLSARHATAGAAGDSGSLLDLFDTSAPASEALGAAEFRDVELCYEAALPGDCWILCAGTPLADDNEPALSALASSGMPLSVSVVVDSLPHLTADEHVPAMITVEI
jgi:type VI secretion system protein ImpM